MEELYWLHQIESSNQRQVGEKALFLSQLLKGNYPVLPGFVIPASFLKEFLGTIEWLEPLFEDLASSSLYLDLSNSQQLQTIAQRVRQEIMTAAWPESWIAMLEDHLQGLQTTTVILRPSFVVQGLQKDVHRYLTKLIEPCICWANREAFLKGLKQTWSKFFRAKNLLCYQHYGIGLEQLSLAILVQPLEPALASGSLQVQGELLEIQSVWGLGLSLSLGEVTPDYYRIQLNRGKLEAFYPGNRSYAYRLRSGPSADSTSSESIDCLESYIPDLESKQDALEAGHLEQLVHLSQKITAELGQNFKANWTILEPQAGSKLYLTHLKPRTETPLLFYPASQVKAPTSFSMDDPSREHPLLEGVAISSGQVLAKAYVIGPSSPIPQSLSPNTILVAPMLSPDWLPLLKQAAGFIVERGGATSHAAIIARELRIPAIAGADQATQQIHTGDLILLLADQGTVYPVGSRAVQLAGKTVSLPPEANPLDEITTPLMVNLSQVESLPQACQLPLAGIGLIRSELMLLDLLDNQHPDQWISQQREDILIQRLTERLQHFSQAFTPRPVFYRSLDLRSHEFQSLQRAKLDLPELNPILGIHGTSAYLRNPALLDLELQAISHLYQAGFTNIRLLLPFVRTVEEFIFCRQRVEAAGLFAYEQFQLWIMAEVPSILFLLPELKEAGVQGISIGTNDLTQLLLGVDRDQEQLPMAQSSNTLNSAQLVIRRAIEQFLQTAQRVGLPCSICGQAPTQYPDLIYDLLSWGITFISVEPNAVETTHQQIIHAEQQLLLEINQIQKRAPH